MATGKKRVELKFFDDKLVKAALARYHSDPEFRKQIDSEVDRFSDRIRAEANMIALQLLLHGATVLIEAPVGTVHQMTILDPAQTFVHYINEIIPAKSPRRKLRLVKIAKAPELP
jgi:hypothetical protein